MKLSAVISLTVVAVVRATVNYPELQHCTTEDGQPGVRCGEKCLWSGGWCRDDMSASCRTPTTQFSTRDASLCRNTTFWSIVDCNVYHSDGEVALYGKRCSADKQHCYYPWYTKNTEDFEHENGTRYLPTCQDNSDRIFAMNTYCKIIEYVKEYCDTICNKINKHKHCKENICENPTEWFSQETDSFILDPHNCSSSCQNPSRVCDVCTNTKEYFKCIQSGVCIHRDLLCDGHKHCQRGEDEDYDSCPPSSTENYNSNNITLQSLTAQNVFYAVEDFDSKKLQFRIFSQISQCRIFINMENKVIYKLENTKWTIGKIKRERASTNPSKTCFHLVEKLNIENEYKLNGNRLTDISYWKNLKDKEKDKVRIRTRKIKEENWTWSLKLIEGIKNSSSTWEKCRNLVLDFYKTKSTKIIVSFQENAKECFHSDDFSVRLRHNSNAYIRILESNPDRNLKNKTNNDVDDGTTDEVGGETTASSDIPNKTTASSDIPNKTTASSDIPDKTDNITDIRLNLPPTDSVSENVTLYTSIGLGALTIILLALISLFIVKLRKQNNVPVVITYQYSLGKASQ